jgi:hypothetical protein
MDIFIKRSEEQREREAFLTFELVQNNHRNSPYDLVVLKTQADLCNMGFN